MTRRMPNRMNTPFFFEAPEAPEAAEADTQDATSSAVDDALSPDSQK